MREREREGRERRERKGKGREKGEGDISTSRGCKLVRMSVYVQGPVAREREK